MRGRLPPENECMLVIFNVFDPTPHKRNNLKQIHKQADITGTVLG